MPASQNECWSFSNTCKQAGSAAAAVVCMYSSITKFTLPANPIVQTERNVRPFSVAGYLLMQQQQVSCWLTTASSLPFFIPSLLFFYFQDLKIAAFADASMGFGRIGEKNPPPALFQTYTHTYATRTA